MRIDREGSVIASFRKTGRFVVLALAMASWMGLLGSLRGVAGAGLTASNLPEAKARSEDLAKVQSFLENKWAASRTVYVISQGVTSWK